MSLKDISKELSLQTDLMHEIGTDIYSYLDSVVVSSDLNGVRLEDLQLINQQMLEAIKQNKHHSDNGSSPNSGDDLEEKRDRKIFDNKILELMKEISVNTKGTGNSRSTAGA